MEILIFDTGKRTNISKDYILEFGSSIDVTTNQKLKRTLIASILCATFKSISAGCCML
ncbi:MAG: hypothetical protein GQ564_04610 [Bacteroidales bacterium]|nr:hypothetical protein [Bacteroidales bacterium]